MAKFLKVLSIIVIVFGIIGSIIMAINFGTTKEVVSTIYDTSVKTKTNIGVLLGVLVSGLLSTAILYGILAGLSEVIEKLEKLDFQTKTLNKENLISIKKQDSKVTSSSGGWECPQCGNYNEAYTSTCKCGRRRI